MIVTLGKHPSMNGDLDALHRVYEALGVQVIRLSSGSTDAVFHRDVAAWTPWGLILAHMGKTSRRSEPAKWLRKLRGPGVFLEDDPFGHELGKYTTPKYVVPSPCSFEGADLLMVDGSEYNHGGEHQQCVVLAIGPRSCRCAV